MSAIEPGRDEVPERVPEPKEPERNVPDRWGVKRAENLIQSLQGVLSARVVVSPIGEVTEVHVLTSSGTPPKQVVRNVESALLAHLGLKVDHRKVSVAQTADVQPIQALEKHAVREEALKRGIVFRGVDIRISERQRVVIAVTLVQAGERYTGEQEVADTPKSRFVGAARATVDALDKILPEGTLELEGVTRFAAFETEFAFAGVQVLEGRQHRVLAGSARIGDSVEQAAVLAVLDATNRWMDSRR